MNIFVSHAVAVGLTILMLAALIISLNSVSDQWRDFLGDFEPKHVCLSLENVVEDLYLPSDLNTTSVLSSVLVELPKKTGGSDYTVLFSNQTIFVNSDKSYNCTVFSDLVLKGSAKGNKAKLTFMGPNIIEITSV